MRMWILKYEYKKWRDKALQFIVRRLPHRLLYFCAVRVIAEGTTGKYSKTEVTTFPAMEALRRWESALGRAGKGW